MSPTIILTTLAKGMSSREILRVFPELSLQDVRDAVVRVAELVSDLDASLPSADDDVLEILRKAQRNTDLSVSEGEELAVAETRAFRREKSTARRAR